MHMTVRHAVQLSFLDGKSIIIWAFPSCREHLATFHLLNYLNLLTYKSAGSTSQASMLATHAHDLNQCKGY
jgi:hypothetical protein